MKKRVCGVLLRMCGHFDSDELFRSFFISELDRESGTLVYCAGEDFTEGFQAIDVPQLTLGADRSVPDDLKDVLSKTVISNLKICANIYKMFTDISSVSHAHSLYATAYAQAGRSIKPYGVTHAELFRGNIPCSRKLTPNELGEVYEDSIGQIIKEVASETDHADVPAVLIHSHGAFSWGRDSVEAAERINSLETVARLAFLTETIVPERSTGVRMQEDLLTFHYNKTH